jgi:glycosyltransferase involved in cell wall biosynthesis
LNVGILAHLLDVRPGYRQAGVSRYIEHLIRELPAASPDQFIVYGGRHSYRQFDGPERRSGIRFVKSRIPTGRPETRILWEQAIAPAQLARDQIDVVHATVNVAPIVSGRATVVTVHDVAFLRFPDQYPGVKQRYLASLTRRSVERADQVIAVSENTRNDLLHCYDVPPERVVVVPNGVDPAMSPARADERMAEFKKEHALPDEFILFLGTLQPRKNLIALLRAWSKLDPEERLPLVVVGAQGWMYEPIYDEARSLGVAGHVVFKGFAEPADLKYWYSAATIFVYPSLYEGFGMPVLEAMACGTPVVASNASSLPEVAGDAALLVDPSNVDSLKEAIDTLTRDTAKRGDLSQRGIARAATFSWTRTARETASVYRLALAEHDAKRKD